MMPRWTSARARTMAESGATHRPICRHYARDIQNTGGGEVVKQVAKTMSDLGWDVEVVTDTPRNAVFIDGVRIRATPLGGVLIRWRPQRKLGWTIRHVLQIVVYTLGSTWIGRTDKRNGVVGINHNCESLRGQIVVYHNVFSAELAGRGLNHVEMLRAWLNPVRAIRILKERAIASRPGKFHVAVSAAAACDVEDLVPANSAVVIIENGVDTAYFDPKCNSREHAPYAGDVGSMSRHTVLFVGHEFRRKGLDELLEAMTHLPLGVDLCVVGGASQDMTSYRAAVSRLGLQSRVRWVGEHDDVRPFYWSADVLCLPSRYETMGLVGLEALAAGTPIVVTRGSPLADLVEPGLNGELCEREPGSIADALARVLFPTTGPFSRARVRETVLGRDWGEVGRAYSELASSLLPRESTDQ